MNSNVEQQLLANQSDMLRGIGRLEKGQEVANGRLTKLEEWKEGRWKNMPVVLTTFGGLSGWAVLATKLVGWW